ncbi:protein FAM169B isoform X2 [Takifugu rubripes]|uniref:protein FAM169B isoform X2 n=1 Tax=Takifugu rubripes TaxID=31033 RepID=UPI001145B383|nr:protein FAM169B-like isoform X2 [Takifugu rubripes]
MSTLDRNLGHFVTGPYLHTASSGSAQVFMDRNNLPVVSDTDLTLASEQYFSSLEQIPHKTKEFQSSTTNKTTITVNTVTRLQLFEDGGADCTLLVLHPSGDPTQVLAVYLHDKWWPVDDVLRTTVESRSGLLSVQSIVERVIVFLLSRVVDRSLDESVCFSLHPRTESCSLLWRDGQAIGFYTVKHKGSLCDTWSGQGYLLPVLDTVLVRKSCRRRGFGSQMLENFCSTFYSENILGVSSPLSPGWAAVRNRQSVWVCMQNLHALKDGAFHSWGFFLRTVCRRFLQQREEYRDRLYEVEAPGSWTQRRNIWLNIQLGCYTLCINEENSRASGDRKKNDGNCSSQEPCNANHRVGTVSPAGPSPGGSILDSNPAAELLQSRNTNQTLTSASFPATKPPREKQSPQQINAKRARTT